MQTDVYNFKNEKVGITELPDSIFNVPWKPALVKQVILAQIANRRRPWAHAKGRGEVRGGGRKPWRQKGTGRARHGSIRSPIWKGGGKAHGPTKERDYSQKVNKKMKQIALLSALSRKLKDGDVKVFENLSLEQAKTKLLHHALAGLISREKRVKKFDVLLIPEPGNKVMYRAASNLVKTVVRAPQSLNVTDLLNHRNVFISREAIPVMEKHYAVRTK